MIENTHNLNEIRDVHAKPEMILNTSVNEVAQNECDSGKSHEISSSEVSTIPPKAPPPPCRTSNSGLKALKIILERLPIKYLSSDDEENSQELENVTRRKQKSLSIREKSSSFLEVNYGSIQSSNLDLTYLIS